MAMKELFEDTRNDDSMYLFAMEERAYYDAVYELAGYIQSGAVTEEQAFNAVREALHGNKS